MMFLIFKLIFQSVIPTVQISKTFAGAFHTQSVRSIATGGHYLASGGADERIRIYDLKSRQEIRELLHHKGTVNSVVFVDKYLITGGSDGQIAFINTKKWQLDKVWHNAHKGAVTCISVHPEQSLALTIGTDLVLKSWNLVNGRNIYSTNLKNKTQYNGVVEHIKWSPNGDHFAVTGAKIVEIFSLDTGNVIKTRKLDSRITDLCWIGDADILVGLDNGEMFFFNIENDESNTIPAHDTRLKAMFYVEGLLATISSSGDLSIWDISDDYTEIIQLKEYSLECRPTCLSIVETSKLGLSIERQSNTNEDAKPDFQSENKVTFTPNEHATKKECVTVMFENDVEILSRRDKKKRRIAETIEHTVSSNEPEEFKGQRKRKAIEQQVKTALKPKEFKKKNPKKSVPSIMEFEVTDNIIEEAN